MTFDPTLRRYNGISFTDELERLDAKLRTAATIADGVIRWNSNNAVPPEGCVLRAFDLGLPVDQAKCDAERAADCAKSLAAYRKANAGRKLTAEERFEARAAHGPGVRLVNVITGDVHRT